LDRKPKKKQRERERARGRKVFPEKYAPSALPSGTQKRKDGDFVWAASSTSISIDTTTARVSTTFQCPIPHTAVTIDMASGAVLRNKEGNLTNFTDWFRVSSQTFSSPEEINPYNSNFWKL